MTPDERLNTANEILGLLMSNPPRLERAANGRLYLVKGDLRKAAVLYHGTWLATDTHLFGMGGTYTVATAMLVRWVRDLTRKRLEWWLGVGGPQVVEVLEATDYADPAKTCCVFCGRTDGQMDWFSHPDHDGPGCYGYFAGECVEAGQGRAA
jgi:hypothetical protein